MPCRVQKNSGGEFMIMNIKAIAILDRSDLTAQEIALRNALDDLGQYLRTHAELLTYGRMYGFEIGISDDLRQALYLMQGDKKNGETSLSYLAKTTCI